MKFYLNINQKNYFLDYFHKFTLLINYIAFFNYQFNCFNYFQNRVLQNCLNYFRKKDLFFIFYLSFYNFKY